MYIILNCLGKIWISFPHKYSPLLGFRSVTLIEQKGMTFDHGFCYSFSFPSSLFLGGKRKGERITKSRCHKSCLSARSSHFSRQLWIFRIQPNLKMLWKSINTSDDRISELSQNFAIEQGFFFKNSEFVVLWV